MSESARSLLLAAQSAPSYSNEQFHLFEQALRAAQAENAADLERYCRYELVTAGVWSGHGDSALIHFSWCLAEAERHPERMARFDLLWPYKWIVDEVWYFPSISRDRIHGLQEDFRQALLTASVSKRSWLHRKGVSATAMGEMDVALEFLEEAESMPRGRNDDCRACELDDQTFAYGFAGQYARALDVAEPLLNGHGCAEVPHRTLGVLAHFADRLSPGSENARHLHRRGLSLQVADNSKLGECIAAHVTFAIRIGDLGDAARILNRYAPVKLRSRVPLPRLYLLHSAALLAERVLELEPEARPHWQLPGVPAEIADDAARAAWLRAETTTLARAFDQRNGHDGISRRLAWFEARAGA